MMLYGCLILLTAASPKCGPRGHKSLKVPPALLVAETVRENCCMGRPPSRSIAVWAVSNNSAVWAVCRINAAPTNVCCTGLLVFKEGWEKKMSLADEDNGALVVGALFDSRESLANAVSVSADPLCALE